MEPEILKYWLAFSKVPGIGRARLKLLESYFGTLDHAWRAGGAELQAAGLDRRTTLSITTRRNQLNPDEELERLNSSGVSAITWHDADYPPRLREIYDLPPLLYIRGALRPDDERSLAVVGTRRPSAYGSGVAGSLTHDLARAGVTILSGLARGVDGIAHRAALDAGRRTIAVLGSGVDVIYPSEHAKLAERILENGALISEHPLGAKPDARNFPRRNRIMAGMTLGTLVIEGSMKSGALITAKHALDENREVFAVPGDISRPNSEGVNWLIKESGAKLVTDCSDILEELNISSVVEQQIEMAALFPEDENESQVLRYVTYDPVHIDEVIRNAGLGISVVSGVLAMMELKGLIKQVGGMNYIRLREASAEYQTAV